jgi:hypothetical protein
MPYVSGCVSTSEVTNKFEIIIFTNLLSFKILCHISKISDSHKSIPHSLIDYYQECGHAGRDMVNQQLAFCFIIMQTIILNAVLKRAYVSNSYLFSNCRLFTIFFRRAQLQPRS